ncbi:MAG: hypothetical protein V3V12_02495 [Gammaproteobacteria bacterium]
MACALPMHEMQEAFKESLQNTMGRTLESLKYHPGLAFIGNREPSEVRRLGNGNILQVYRDYWGQIGIDRGMCRVVLEFDSNIMTVVKVYAEGPGCYAAY